MARILVLDGHCSAALAFVRSLGRAGHWVAVAAGADSPNTAALSRYCRASQSYPSFLEDSQQACRSVAQIAATHHADMIVPLTDATVWPLTLFREEAGVLPAVAAANRDALTVALDKHRTMAAAAECGVRAPRTLLVRSLSDLAVLDGWSLPLVVKDRFSIRWIGSRGVPGRVAFPDSREALRTLVETRLREAGDVLVQEFCPGDGIGFSCFAIEGEVYLPFQWRRLREKDPRGSGSSARRSLPLDPRISECALRLLKALDYSGLAMIEFKRRGSDFYLMEVNARPWGSLQLPAHCGIDYPQSAARWYLGGERPERCKPYKVGITSRSLVDDLVHLENVWEGRPRGWPLPYPRLVPTLLKVLTPWYPGLRYDDLWLRDPRPATAGLARWLERHGQSWLGWRKGKATT